MKREYTHITLVVDRSGSMSSIQTDAQGGINKLIADQKAEPGTASFYLAQFDDVHEDVYGPGPLQDCPTYTLVPRNSTALWDAVGKAIAKTGEYLKALEESERPEKVIFAVVTDGHENASVEWKGDKVREAVKLQTDKYNWQFVFIGANIDAYATGMGMGFSSTAQYAGTGASTRGVFANTSQTVSNYRNAPTATYMGAVASVDAAGNSETVGTVWDEATQQWVKEDDQEPSSR
jgi:hypothetical protein